MAPKIILASTSPRRIELLTAARVRFETRSPDADETPHRGESPRRLVARLAREKAASVAAVASLDHGHVLVISADTTVVAPDGKKVLNKPRSRAEAIRMITRLSGATHTVLTGYCLREAGRTGGGADQIIVRVVASRVMIRKLSQKQIEAYVSAGESMDKAGAYAAQGYGMTLIERISGSYTNVVGLPMAQLMRDLESFLAER